MITENIGIPKHEMTLELHYGSGRHPAYLTGMTVNHEATGVKLTQSVEVEGGQMASPPPFTKPTSILVTRFFPSHSFVEARSYRTTTILPSHLFERVV
jgi:hypothetical protein